MSALQLFEYEAVDPLTNEVRRAVRRAAGEQDVAQHVMARGLTLTNVRPRAWWMAFADTMPWSRPDKETLDAFFQDLSLILGAGSDDYRKVLTVLARDARKRKKKRFAEALEAIGYEATVTSSVADAMERFPFAFTPLMVSLMRAGERGAGLERTANDIHELLEEEIAFDEDLSSATQEGRLSLTVFAYLLYGTFAYAVPELVKQFSQPGHQMPPILGAADALAHVLGSPLVVVGEYVVLLLLWFPWVLRVFSSGNGGGQLQLTADWIALHVPLFGPIRRLSAQGRFAATMGALWRRSGNPHEALALAIPATGHATFIRGFSEIADAYTEGIPLSALLRRTGLCDEHFLLPLERAEEGGLDVADRLVFIGKKLREAARKRLTKIARPLGTILTVAVGTLGVLFAIVLAVLVYQIYVSYSVSQ